MTKEQAIKNIHNQQPSMCYNGKWYDPRGCTPEEVRAFQAELLGIKSEEIPGVSMDVNIQL